MNNKFYSSPGTVSATTAHERPLQRPLSQLGAAVSVLLLAACSSSGSGFGPGSGSMAMGATGNTDSGGRSGDTGGTSPAAGGDTVIPNAGNGPSGGGSVGQGGASATGGATQSGGGASGGNTPNGGAPAGGGSTGGAGGGTGEVCPKGAGQICHEFVANDNSRNEVHYVNEFAPTKNWTMKVGDTGQNSPRGIQIVNNAAAKAGKAILVSIEHGFAQFDMVGGAPLGKVSSFGSVTSILQIPSDGSPTKFPGAIVLARDLNPPELDFVDITGKALTPAVKLPFAAAGSELRKLERNPTTGNFSLTKYESAASAYIYEVTEGGGLVNKIKLPAGGKGYNAVWAPGGGLMATTGSLATVISISTTGAVSATLGGPGKLKDSTGASVYTDFFSGFYLLPNGNVVAANWLGHVDPATHPTTPELLEISPTNQLVWTWGNQSIATWVTYGYMIR